jgi:two-component system chemotaxis response regulator CheB
MASFEFPDLNELELLVIGGSAGSFTVVNRMLARLPKNFQLPIVMCLHRLKDKREGFKEALEIKSMLPVLEPDDKQKIEPGKVYLAPANYHLVIGSMRHFGLATTELVQYSRPSIDVMFESAADIYRSRILAILLSGANRDGALGMKRIKQKGGFTIVQDPTEAAMDTMPSAALQATEIDLCLTAEEIYSYLEQLNQRLLASRV